MKTFNSIREAFRPKHGDVFHITTENNFENIIHSGRILPPFNVDKVYTNFGDYAAELSKGRVHFSGDPDHWIYNLEENELRLAIFMMKPSRVNSYKFKTTNQILHRKYPDLNTDNLYKNIELSLDFFTTKPVPLKDLYVFNFREKSFVDINRDINIDDYLRYPMDIPQL